jgi:adenosylhomocysteine nucleosidase
MRFLDIGALFFFPATGSANSLTQTIHRRVGSIQGAALAVLLCLPLSVVAKVDILLAAASEAELAQVRARMSNVKEQTFTSWTFWRGTLAGKSVVLACTEGDPLNAVASTTLAIRRYEPALVLSYGIARPHDPKLKAGDVVVSEKFVAFDGFISGHRGLGEGTKLVDWKKLPHAPISAGEVETYAESFPASEAVRAAAMGLKNPKGRVLAGVLGSAHQINREADRVSWLRATWGTSCEDMESAHMAVCAKLFGVPAAGIRVISPADASVDEMVAAQALAAEMVLSWVEAIK